MTVREEFKGIERNFEESKGILRYQNDISVFRDGTIRYDMVDITMTHFKPSIAHAAAV